MLAYAARETADYTESSGFVDVDGCRSLYVMTTPKTVARKWGLIVCPSMFEFSRFQPTEILLLRKAAAMGFQGIYLEPPGMGDSEGRFEDCTISVRVRAATTAWSFLARNADMKVSPCWFGARLGAGVALLAAQTTPGAVIAWDPVRDAGTYWAQTRRLARVTAVAQRDRAFKDPDKALEKEGRASLLWLPVTVAIRDDLANIERVADGGPLDGPALLVAVNDDALERARSTLAGLLTDFDTRSLGLDAVEHLGVAESDAALQPTLEWMREKLAE